MKKLLTLCVVMTLAFTLGLAGCKNKDEDDKPTPSPSEQTSPSPSESKKPEKSSNSSDKSSGSDKGSDKSSESGGSGSDKGSDKSSGSGGSGDNSSESGGGSDSGQGSAAEMLKKITEKTTEELGEGAQLPMSFDSEVKAETATGIGLKSEEFEEYVEEAQASIGALTSSAHEIVVLKCKDKNAAIAVKALIAANYDPGKWLSTQPEKCAVIESEENVLLVASSEQVVDAVISAAKAEMGDSSGEANEFFKKEE